VSSRYVTEIVSLTVGAEKTPIPSSLANPVAGVYVMACPGPAALHFGQGGQPLDVVQGKYYKCCPAETDGIFVTNGAAAGFLKVMVTYEGGAIEVSGQDETPAAAAKIVYAVANQPGSVNAGPTIQLWNPPTVGGVPAQNLVVSRVVAGSAVVGFAALLMMRRQLSNNGGGVLRTGAARFLDRRLAPADPIVLVRDAGILGVIAGSNFDNLFYSELGGTFQFPVGEALQTVRFTGGGAVNGDFLREGEPITLAPGWGVSVQHSQNGAGTLMDAFFVASPQ
jgi:hypothetical protein